LAAAVLAALSVASCGGSGKSETTDLNAISRDTGGHELLAAPTGAVESSAYRPSNAYRPVVPGMLARTVTHVEIGGAAIEVRDILVGPGQTTERATLESTAVFTVLSGSGELRIYSRNGRLTSSATVRPGSKGAVPLGASFSVENSSDSQFDMRMRLIAAP
jgi:mannose-6-phosphate isomerase-like protein (cupin superfamily)